jgi:2-polyprenyl-3-methyl-5-hydroxy-6-metoxy-1,4-benzoquinol methylase
MHLRHPAPSVDREPPNASWPEEELETLGACPVCGSRERALTYQDLRDVVFCCAPGVWTAWTCATCHVLYLDPRPTEASIHKAYWNYYTHRRDVSSLLGKFVEKLKVGVRHSHLNKNFGYHLSGALPFGWIAYKWKPLQVEITNHTIRHLPPPQPFGNRLLDIGCGAGEFLEIARDLGFDASGLEIDPVARAQAQKADFIVHPGPFPDAGLERDYYDHITMSHVLEHLHDPMGAIREALILLKPGGRIWIKIPSLSALSYFAFGRNLRLLETPRHLVMFDAGSLEATLRKCGFIDVLSAPPSFLDQNYSYRAGWAISQNLNYDPMSLPDVPPSVEAEIVSTYERASSNHKLAEFVTMVATKPNSPVSPDATTSTSMTSLNAP